MKLFNTDNMTPASAKSMHTCVTKNDLSINYECTGRILSVSLSGRLDTLSAPEFQEFFEKYNEEHDVCELRLDFKDLNYLSSTGLRVLMMISKKLGKKHVIITNCNDVVEDIFTATGFEVVVTLK